MRKNSAVLDWAKGRVSGRYINLATGETCGDFTIPNVITYSAADIMARLLGGDQQYRPGYMGFIYGTSNTPSASLIEPPVARTQTWSGLATELADSPPESNILITPFSAGAAYTRDGDAGYYNANAVTLTAHTGSRLEYGFPTTAPYAGELADGNYFWHAMLLTRIVRGTTIEYIPFARVTLKGADYPVKPAGFELALFWQVSYF